MLARVLKQNKVIYCEHQIVDKELNILSEKIIFQLKKKRKQQYLQFRRKIFMANCQVGILNI